MYDSVLADPYPTKLSLTL